MPSHFQFQLLEELICDKETLSKLSEEEVFKSLHFIFHDNVRVIEMALDIVDKGVVTSITSSSCDRSFHRVRSAPMSETYIVLNHHCSCKSYSEQFRVLSSQPYEHYKVTPVVCKHMLAVKLGAILGKITNSSIVTDDVFVDMMCNKTSNNNSNSGGGGGGWNNNNNHSHNVYPQDEHNFSSHVQGFHRL